MIFRKFFSVASRADAIQRFTMPLSRQRQTLRVRIRTPAWGLSMTLVVAKQRCSEAGTSSRVRAELEFYSSVPITQEHRAGGGVHRQQGNPALGRRGRLRRVERPARQAALDGGHSERARQ